MKINWKSHEFIFLMGVVFGIIISLGQASSFANFPSDMTYIAWLGVILLVVGLYGIYKAES